MTNNQKSGGELHNVKCWPDVFEEIWAGRKTAEFRLNDRGYKAGDRLLIREWCPEKREYTHREITRAITHVLDSGFGMPAGYAMLSLSRTPSHGRVSDSEDGRLPAAPGLRGFAPEPAAQSQPKALVPDVDHLSARHLYEGVAGGWKDGRFGQAYDLIAEALKERGVIELHGHKLLIDIEMEDMNHE